MNIKVSVENGSVPVTVVHIDGNIDASSYQQFQAKLDELMESGTRHMLIDLSHTPFVSSSGLRALHYVFNKLRENDPANTMSGEEVRRGISAGTYKSPHLKLLNPSKEAKSTFELSGFDMFIESFDDRESALASFQAAS